MSNLNKEQPSNKSFFQIFLRGLFMGAADIIPGVSGGTIAFITGIYERLITGLTGIQTSLFKFCKKPNLKSLKEIDWLFFIPLAFGIALAFLTLSYPISFLLQNYQAYTFSFFFGLIFMSAIVLFKHSKSKDKSLHFKNPTPIKILFAIFGFLLAYSIANLTAANFSHAPLIIFFSGTIAISAMLLPGISGSFLLVLMGQYEYIINAIHDRNLTIVFTFGFGALLGLALFSRLVNYLLNNYKTLTVTFLIGVMLGALRAPYLEIISASSNNGLFLIILIATFGAAIVYLLEKYTND